MTVEFDLAVRGETGVAKIEVTASSGKYTATDVIEIEIRIGICALKRRGRKVRFAC